MCLLCNQTSLSASDHLRLNMCPSKLPPILHGGEERALDALLVGLADMDERVRQQARDGSNTNKRAIFRKLDAVSVGIPPPSLSLPLLADMSILTLHLSASNVLAYEP